MEKKYIYIWYIKDKYYEIKFEIIYNLIFYFFYSEIFKNRILLWFINNNNRFIIDLSIWEWEWFFI